MVARAGPKAGAAGSSSLPDPTGRVPWQGAACVKVLDDGRWHTGSLAWQPRPGAWALTVVCHAVFSLEPTESPMVAWPARDAGEHDDERRFAEPWGPIAPVKQWPEVIVVGHAYAPEGRTARMLLARLAVGSLEKVVAIHGDSHLTRSGAVVEPAPFARMPLTWRRAAGGPLTTNPAGVPMGEAAIADTSGHVHLPNLRPAGAQIRSRAEVVPPTGFGPLGPGWPSRLQRLGHHAAGWDPERWSERPLPGDLDASYFDVAPADQALGELTGSERIVLEHLHPQHPWLMTHLRVQKPRAVASTPGTTEDVPLRCDTLVIDTDRAVAVLVWRGRLAIDHPHAEGVVRVSSAPVAGADDVEEATIKPTRALSPALPFQATAAPPAPAAPPPARRTTVETQPGPIPFRKPALPFLPSPPGGAPPAPQASADEDPPTPRRGLPSAPAFSPVPSPLPVHAPAPPPPPKEPPPSEDTLERCAAISAKIALAPSDRDALLKEERIGAALWQSRLERWLREVDAELSRGKRKLRARYDAAYVAALEEARGPITPAAYARLSIAADRGQGAEELAAMGMPAEALLPIRRVWLERCVKDPRTAAEVRAAVRAEAED
jgi:Uncharacterized protein conserved in bacteria (DUF2169)